MTAILITSICLFVGTILAGALEGYLDARFGTAKDHSIDFKKRLMMGIPMYVIANILLMFKYEEAVLLITVASFFMCVGGGFWYGFMLDIVFNHNATYVGNTAETDKLARKNSIEGFVIWKLIGALVGTFLYYAWIFIN